MLVLVRQAQAAQAAAREQEISPLRVRPVYRELGRMEISEFMVELAEVVGLAAAPMELSVVVTVPPEMHMEAAEAAQRSKAEH